MGYPTLAYSAGIGAKPFMAYMSSSLRGISACIEPSSNGSIIMCDTGGLKGGPVRNVSVKLESIGRSSITRVEALPLSRRGVV